MERNVLPALKTYPTHDKLSTCFLRKKCFKLMKRIGTWYINNVLYANNSSKQVLLYYINLK